MTNDKASKLGTTPLPDGVVRVVRDNGRDGLAYLTQQTIKDVPIGDKIELNLGPGSSLWSNEGHRQRKGTISRESWRESLMSTVACS